MLELVCETVGHLIEAARRAITCAWGGIGVLLLVACRVVAVVKVSLAVDATARRLCAPYLLLTRGVGERLWEG
jgi:hypothetical protein